LTRKNDELNKVKGKVQFIRMNSDSSKCIKIDAAAIYVKHDSVQFCFRPWYESHVLSDTNYHDIK